MRNHCAGNVAVEYLVVFLLVVTVLFGPSPSAIDQVVNALQHFYRQLTFLLAMP